MILHTLKSLNPNFHSIVVLLCTSQLQSVKQTNTAARFAKKQQKNIILPSKVSKKIVSVSKKIKTDTPMMIAKNKLMPN